MFPDVSPRDSALESQLLMQLDYQNSDLLMVIDKKAENLDAAWVYLKYPLSFHLKYASRMGITKMLSAGTKFVSNNNEEIKKLQLPRKIGFQSVVLIMAAII